MPTKPLPPETQAAIEQLTREIHQAVQIAATWPLAAGMSALEVRPVMSHE